MPDWTFLTNHAHVLLCIARDPGIRLRDIAHRVGITERAAQRIVADLTTAGYLAATREGRRNHYQLNPTLPLRHPLERDHHIGEILAVLTDHHHATPSDTRRVRRVAGRQPDGSRPATSGEQE